MNKKQTNLVVADPEGIESNLASSVDVDKNHIGNGIIGSEDENSEVGHDLIDIWYRKIIRRHYDKI